MGVSIYDYKILFGVIIVCICTVSYLSLDPNQRQLLFTRLHLRETRPYSTDTPPRSISPSELLRGKDSHNDALPEKNEYMTTFPESRRHVLGDLATKFPTAEKAKLGDLKFDEAAFTQALLGWEEDYRSAATAKYSYSRFSVQEIKALGDFPDYAALSGVPVPQAYREFDINKAKPRPYRPFRWAYHQTMSLTKLEPDWWIELENTYKDRIAQRKSLYAEHGEGVLQWLPGSELACKELMEMALQFLCARYPHYFRLLPSSDWSDKTILENHILGTRQIVQDKHPLLVLLDNIPEDFAIMLRNPNTGYYHFRAGIICSAIGWNVATKISKRLHEIHEPVPDYKEKMQFSMDRYFSKMPIDKPIQRGSWTFEVDEPLYVPPGDSHEKYRDLQSPEVTLDRVHLRVDWQTLRRLPLSGAIVFNFKALFTPVTEFRTEAGLPSMVLKLCREGKENLMKPKNTWDVEHVLLPAMEQYKKEQIEQGLIGKDEEVATPAESPFFPGWEDKWHAQQGF